MALINNERARVKLTQRGLSAHFYHTLISIAPKNPRDWLIFEGMACWLAPVPPGASPSDVEFIVPVGEPIARHILERGWIVLSDPEKYHIDTRTRTIVSNEMAEIRPTLLGLMEYHQAPLSHQPKRTMDWLKSEGLEWEMPPLADRKFPSAVSYLMRVGKPIPRSIVEGDWIEVVDTERYSIDRETCTIVKKEEKQ